VRALLGYRCAESTVPYLGTRWVGQSNIIWVEPLLEDLTRLGHAHDFKQAMRPPRGTTWELRTPLKARKIAKGMLRKVDGSAPALPKCSVVRSTSSATVSGSGLFAKRRHCIIVKLFGNVEARMNQQEFEASLKEDGYTEIEVKSLRPRPRNDEHGHPFAVRGLVLAGAFTVTQRNITKTYRTGEIFSVASGQDHSEEVGPDGAEVVVGRKY